MLFWTLQITVISIILIFLVHNLIGFFKSTLTVPKVKDLVNAPAQKYENMLNVLAGSSGSSNHSSNAYLPPPEEEECEPVYNIKPNVSSMKNELKNFLKNKLKGGNGNGNGNGNRNNEAEHTTSIACLDLGSANSLSFSAY